MWNRHICNRLEYLVESPDEIKEEIAKQLKKAMEDAGAIFCKVVKLEAEPEIAKFWKH